MTQEHDDPADKLIRTGESWWVSLLKDGKISIPNIIMMFLLYVMLNAQIQGMKETLRAVPIQTAQIADIQATLATMKNSTSDRWTGGMQKEWTDDTATMNPTWRPANVREVQRTIRESYNIP